MKFKSLASFFCVLPLFACEAGSVQLWSGEIYKGRVTLEGSGFAIYPDQGAPTKVELAKARDAIFVDPQPAAAEPTQPQGSFLVNGTFLAGNTRSLETPVAKVESQDVPATGLAWVIFRPVPLDKFPKLPPGHTGAILASGDFFEGKFAGVKDYRIGVDSPLFGPQRFSGDQVLALILHDRQDSHSLYKVTATNGSSYETDDLKFDKQLLYFQDSILGAVKIKITDIREIAPGGGRFATVTSLQPLDPAPGAKVADSFRIQPAADSSSPDKLLTLANVPVSYTIPPGLGVFTSGVSVPKDAPAGTRFTFAVYGDGKFLIQRSLPMAVGDPPQTLRAELNNVHTLVLRAEPSFPGSEKIYGEWTGPMLFRP